METTLNNAFKGTILQQSINLTLGGEAMFLTRWKNSQEVPEFEGILSASGVAYEFRNTRIFECSEFSKSLTWLSVCVLASQDLYGGKYRVRCGEAAQHGSIGVIVLESILSGDAVWSLVCLDSNPFDQIVVNGGHILVISTSGAVFRFRAELQDVTLSIPSVAN